MKTEPDETPDRPQLPDADTCVEIFHAALGKGDTRGVEAALRILAVQDPRRAGELLELTRVALVLAGRTAKEADCA